MTERDDVNQLYVAAATACAAVAEALGPSDPVGETCELLARALIRRLACAEDMGPRQPRSAPPSRLRQPWLRGRQ